MQWKAQVRAPVVERKDLYAMHPHSFTRMSWGKMWAEATDKNYLFECRASELASAKANVGR
jgi:hypothetical protein